MNANQKIQNLHAKELEKHIFQAITDGYILQKQIPYAAIMTKPFKGHIAYAFGAALFAFIASPIFMAFGYWSALTSSSNYGKSGQEFIIVAMICEVVAIFIALAWAVEAKKTRTLLIRETTAGIHKNYYVNGKLDNLEKQTDPTTPQTTTEAQATESTPAPTHPHNDGKTQ